MMAFLRLAGVVLLLGLRLPVAWAQEVPVPPLVGPVNDYAHVFTQDAGPLSAALLALHQELGVQLVVLTMPSLGDDAIAAFANRVMEAWHLGDKRQDTGLLLLVVPQDRMTRIEVGYGLEGIVPDAESKRIQATYLRPRPNEPLTQAHIVAAVGALRALLLTADAKDLLPKTNPLYGPDGDGLGLHHAGWLFAGLMVIGLFAFLMFRKLPAQSGLHPSGGPQVLGASMGPRKSDFLSLLVQLLISLFSGRGGGGGSSGGGYSGGGGKSGGGGSSDRY